MASEHMGLSMQGMSGLTRKVAHPLSPVRGRANSHTMLILVVSVVIPLLGLSSCTGTAEPPEEGERMAGSMVELFEEELRDPTLSEFERDVFTRAVETGSISAADYEAASQLYRRCLEDSGAPVEWTKGPDGIYVASWKFSAQDDPEDIKKMMGETAGNCAQGTLVRIEALYRIQQNNPGLLADPFEAVIDCWRRVGKDLPDYGPADLEKEITSIESGPPHYSFDLSDTDVRTCLADSGFSFID